LSASNDIRIQIENTTSNTIAKSVTKYLEALIMMYAPYVDRTRTGPAGEVLAANIRRVRTEQRLGYAELSRLLADIGRPIPELGLRRIELCERRVDVDDLLAISYVLRIAVVDLLVDKDATTEPYPLIPSEQFESESVRDWIRGETVHLARHKDPESPWAEPGELMFEAIQHMPKDRARRVAREWGEDQE
jgi:hypothetical protein